MIEYCGHEPPLILYTDDNWSHRPTTKDQKRIENVLGNYANKDAVWLHIGIGNSSLAKRIAHKIKKLDGLTVVMEEIQVAPRILNYFPVFMDKHSMALRSFGSYDLIIDTTPSGHACCKKHLIDYLITIGIILKDNGVLLTDEVGLAWARTTSIGFTPDDFAQLIKDYKLILTKGNNRLIEIRKVL